MRTRLMLALVPATLLLLAGCEQLTATTQAASVLIRTPQLDQTLPSSLSAIVPVADLADAGATVASVAVGKKDGITDTSPSPVSGATVSLSYNGSTVALCEMTDAGTEGTYSASSIEGGPCGDPSLEYVSDADYTMEIETGGELYSLSVTAPAAVDSSSIVLTPALEEGAGLASLLPRHAIDTALTLDWKDAGDAADQPAVVAVLRVNYTGNVNNPTDVGTSANWEADADNPVYTNAPESMQDFLGLLSGDSNGSLEVPADAFSSQGLYFVVITPVVVSTDTSSNLALGSGTLAGAGTAFAFWVD